MANYMIKLISFDVDIVINQIIKKAIKSNFIWRERWRRIYNIYWSFLKWDKLGLKIISQIQVLFIVI